MAVPIIAGLVGLSRLAIPASRFIKGAVNGAKSIDPKKAALTQNKPLTAGQVATRNTATLAPVAVASTFAKPKQEVDPGKNSPNVGKEVQITKEGSANEKSPKPASAAPTPKATIKKAEKVVKVTAKPVADDANETPGGAIAIKDMGTKDSVQLHGNVDGYGSQHDLPEVKDPTEGMSEDALKKIGLDTSNAEMAERGDKGSLFGRLSEGNIDDPNSVAYKKYGAGYGREVLRRRAAGK
jgi:hypothetical protein